LAKIEDIKSSPKTGICFPCGCLNFSYRLVFKNKTVVLNQDVFLWKVPKPVSFLKRKDINPQKRSFLGKPFGLSMA
jgi:hypothetical protein